MCQSRPYQNEAEAKILPKDDGRDDKLFVIPLVPSQRMLKLKSNQMYASFVILEYKKQ